MPTMWDEVVLRRRVDNLRREYREIAAELRQLVVRGERGDADRVRLEAREIEIVDALRRIGVAPDVLVAA